jgi:glycosyltransferase involved in cell wall biosynthesis
VPAYNYGRFLPQCVASVLEQRDVEVKLTIIDDCSTDDTADVASGLAASDSRITVLCNQRNLGLVPTVNRGFRSVTSDYTVKLDADDMLSPGSLARATALMEAHPAAAFVYGRPRHFSGPVPAVPDSPSRSWTVWSGHQWLEARCRSGACVISQPEVVIRTSVLRRALPVREDLPHTSDMYLWMRLATMGDVGRVNGPVQGLYRVHDASMQRTIHAGIMTDLAGRKAAFDALLEADPCVLPQARELVSCAHRSLASTALDFACRAYDRGRTRDWPVDELIAFALKTHPDIRRRNEWIALERRRAVGEARAQRSPRFFADAVTRRMSEELARRYWLLTGEA